LRCCLQGKTTFWNKPARCAIGYMFQICSWHRCQQLYVVDKRPLTVQCLLLTIFFQIANSHTRWLCNFQKLSQDGRRTYFYESSGPYSLMKIYRITLISAGFISLDSTFNAFKHMFSIRFMLLSAFSACF
jgi:hypothetical protein